MRTIGAFFNVDKPYTWKWLLSLPDSADRYRASCFGGVRMITEHKRKYNERWRAEHPEYHHQWRIKHPGYYHQRYVEHAEYAHQWYTEHLESIREYKKRYSKTVAYHETHRASKARRRAIKRNAITGKIDYQAIKVRDRMICCICKKKVAVKDLSFDHSVPLSRGGSHTQENIRVAHLRCNLARGVGRLPVQLVLN